MTDCAHGNGPFRRMAKPQRDQIQREVFGILKEHMECGFIISFDLRYKHLCPSAVMHGIGIVSPYSLCCYWGLMCGRKWAEDSGFNGDIAYFFQAGHRNQTQANHIMNEIFDVPALRKHYRYRAHAFVQKKDAIALQCADILAWQWAKNIKERKKGNMRPRADLWTLLEKPHFTIHFDEPMIMQFREVVKRANAKTAAKFAYAVVQKYGV